MKDPVVLITGALTGIGRATALAFANEGGRSLLRAGATPRATSSSLNSASGASKPSFCAPMCATRTRCAVWLTRRSHGLVAWMWPSILPALKANLAP